MYSTSALRNESDKASVHEFSRMDTNNLNDLPDLTFPHPGRAYRDGGSARGNIPVESDAIALDLHR